MSWFFAQVIVPIIVIGVLVFIHEFGHFLFAKLCGVGIIRFSIGFGPALWRFRLKETEYQIGIIPLGGFVRMVGDMPDMLTGAQATDKAVRGQEASDSADEASVEDSGEEEVPPEVAAVLCDRNRWFIEKNFWQRSAIVVAGPLFNYLLAILLVMLAVFVYGEEQLDQSSRIGSVMSNSPAEKAGLVQGDLVISIDNAPIDSWQQLAEVVHQGSGASVHFSVLRDQQPLEFDLQPHKKEIKLVTGETTSAYFVGIGPTTLTQTRGIAESAYFGVLWTLDKTALTYVGLWGMLSGKVSPKDLAGPLFIIDAAGEQAKRGFDNLLYFMALLSVSLAVLNLLPIPILDGGHLMFFIIEAVLGPISIRKKEFAQQVGMLLLLCLMVFAIHNDIFRDTDALNARVTWEEENGDQSGD